MQRAIDLALDNVRAARGGPFAALIVRDGEIIAEGTNLVTASNDPTAHAEIVAIRRACQHLGSFQLDGCELYSTCEPCPMCLGAIYWARPRALYFAASREDAAQAGFDDEFLYRELNVPLDARRIPTSRLLSEEARRIFEAWNAQPNKIHY
ncbi:MAG: nucleoside deaminase [Bryobacteraceae bacterium]|nr:nucleoside deaminase [Bryobacteraceae bacterium]